MKPDFKLSVALLGLASIMPISMGLEFFSESASQAGPLYEVIVFWMLCFFVWVWWRAFLWMLHCWFTTMPTFGDIRRTIRSVWWNWVRPNRKWDQMRKPDPRIDSPWECPRCMNVFVGIGALSRISTPEESIYVCSDCGVEEAILQWNGKLADWRSQ